jgi:hypothetical protein
MKPLRKHDPKEYWKILNTGKSTKQPDIEFKELFNFFKDLNTLKETNEPENTLNINCWGHFCYLYFYKKVL